MRVALVHDWLNGMRGGEKVLEVLCELFPDAPVYTLLYEPGKLSPTIESHEIRESFIPKLPFALRGYRSYLPLFPLAVRRMDLSEFDLIVSTSHCVAKSARPQPDGMHICYCFTPMRYIWDMFDDYFGPGRTGTLKRWAMLLLRGPLRRWDAATASRVTHFIADSRLVADRIQRCYGRESDVIHPPVDLERFAIADDVQDFYFIQSALAPYKRIDLAVEAFNRLGRPLKIGGTGPEMERLRAKAGANIEFLGWLPDEDLARHYAHCRAFVFPGLEDFGITPLEAMASGRPVVAYGRGGVLDSVLPLGEAEEPTGVFFHEQTVDCLCEAIRECERHADEFNPEALRGHAATFDRPRFKRRLAEYLHEKAPDAPLEL